MDRPRQLLQFVNTIHQIYVPDSLGILIYDFIVSDVGKKIIQARENIIKFIERRGHISSLAVEWKMEAIKVSCKFVTYNWEYLFDTWKYKMIHSTFLHDFSGPREYGIRLCGCGFVPEQISILYMLHVPKHVVLKLSYECPNCSYINKMYATDDDPEHKLVHWTSRSRYTGNIHFVILLSKVTMHLYLW